MPGKYELIPAERGEYAFADTDPLFIGSVLVQPYYFSYATAAFFHGLSTQAAATVYIATSAWREGLLVVRDKEYRLVTQPLHKFFDAEDVDAYGSRVQPIVTIEETMAILGVSYDQARQMLSRLARRRWLAPIVPGKYELIPAERGEYAFSDTNPLFIGSVLVQPYYFSYATAAFFHGLSTQAAATVYIATTTRREGLLVVRDKEYRLVLQPAAQVLRRTGGGRLRQPRPDGRA